MEGLWGAEFLTQHSMPVSRCRWGFVKRLPNLYGVLKVKKYNISLPFFYIKFKYSTLECVKASTVACDQCVRIMALLHPWNELKVKFCPQVAAQVSTAWRRGVEGWKGGGGGGLERLLSPLSCTTHTPSHTLRVVLSTGPWIIHVSGSESPILPPRNLRIVPQTTGIAIYNPPLPPSPPHPVSVWHPSRCLL